MYEGFKEIKEVRDMADGGKWIITESSDEWKIEWVDETTIDLYHTNKRNVKSGLMHKQRSFVDMNQDNIGIIYKYICNHCKYEKNERYGTKRKRSNLDILLGIL